MSVMPNLALGEGGAMDRPLNQEVDDEETGEGCRCPLCGEKTRRSGIGFSQRFVLVNGKSIYLTPAKAVVFGALYRASPNMVHKDCLYAAYVAARRRHLEWPEEKIVDVYIHLLRKKLKKHGVMIESVWGAGYKLSAWKEVTAE